MPETAAPVSTPAAAPAAPSAPAPSSPSTGGYDGAFDRSFTAPADAEASVDGRPPELDSPGESGDETPPAAPEVTTAEDQQAPAEDVQADAEPKPPVVEEEVDPYSQEIKPDSVSQDGRRFFYNKGKAEALMASHKTLQQIREIDPGFSVEQYQEMATRTLELDRMLTDYDSGDPQRVAMVAGDFVGPNKNPQSVAAFIDTAMANAAQHHPQAFQVVQNKVLSGLAQNYYRQYQQTHSEADKKLAQNLDWLARKDFMDPDQQPHADPLAADRARFEQERSQYQLQRNQERQQQVQQFVQGAETAAKSEISQVIEKALDVIPANVRTARAVDYKHAVRDLQDQFEEAVKANPLYERQYQTLLGALRANPGDQSKKVLVDHVRRFADHVIGRSKRDVISRFTNTVTTQTQAAHQKQQEIAQRKEPGGGNNNPVQRATVQQKLKDPNISYADKFEAVFGR